MILKIDPGLTLFQIGLVDERKRLDAEIGWGIEIEGPRVKAVAGRACR